MPETETEFFDEDGVCTRVLWPMNEYPSEENSLTAGKSRAQILALVGTDPIRALAVFREESDKFDDADVELLHDLAAIMDPPEVSYIDVSGVDR